MYYGERVKDLFHNPCTIDKLYLISTTDNEAMLDVARKDKHGKRILIEEYVEKFGYQIAGGYGRNNKCSYC